LYKASKTVERELFEYNKMYEVHSGRPLIARGLPDPHRLAQVN
jgi:hypothetical protein